MLQRLGIAIYWIALLLAAGPLLGVINTEGFDRIFLGLMAFSILFLGWIIRFILTGRRDLAP
jgi:hypothetical protein